MWRLLILILLMVPFVVAQPNLGEFPYVTTLNFTNTTRTYEPILMNISQWLKNNCTMADNRDLRIVVNHSGTLSNISYEFINQTYYHSRKNTTNFYALFIVNDTSDSINLYCGVNGAARTNTTIFEIYDSFENPGTPFWQFWRIQNAARTFVASTSYKINGSQSITRSGQYNPNLNHTINKAAINTRPTTASVGVYTTDDQGAQTANSIVVNNKVGGTEAYEDVGLGLYNSGYFVYDCSNATDTWTDSSFATQPNTWYIMSIKVYASWNELYVDNTLIANCTTAPVYLGALKQVRLTAGKPNDNYPGTSDDKYFDNARLSNMTYNDYIYPNGLQYHSVAAAASTCTYGGTGNWTISCSENCNLTSNTNVAGNLTVSNTSGAGALYLSSGGFLNFTLPGQFMYIDRTCQVKISSGGGIK